MSYARSQGLQCRLVTPDDAREFLVLNTFPGQRPLKQDKANSYAVKMRNGTMRPVDVDVATGPDGIKYLMNGQHVCTAIVVSGKPFEARVQYWKCDTHNDLWHLFCTFDIHASRTEGQVIKAAHQFLGELSDIPLRVLQTSGSAILMISSNPPDFVQGKSEKTAKADLLLPNKDLVLFANEMFELGGRDRRPVFRVAAVAAMLNTYKVSESLARDFWSSVFTGEMLERGTPQYNLSALLMSQKQTQIPGNGGAVRNRYYYSYCIACWNSWRKGERRNGVKVAAMKSVPVPV